MLHLTVPQSSLPWFCWELHLVHSKLREQIKLSALYMDLLALTLLPLLEKKTVLILAT